MWARYLLLTLGVMVASTSAVIIRASDTPVVLLAGYRQLIAALVLAPLYFRDLRCGRASFSPKALWVSVIPGAVLGLHFITWIAGARMTEVANSTLIVNMVPVAMPFLLWMIVRERITPLELVGTGLSLAGVAALVWGDYDLGTEHLTGDVICLVSMLCLGVYLSLGRRNRHVRSIWAYIVPLYATGGLICLVAAMSMGQFPTRCDGRELLLILALGVGPTVIGHSIFNYSLKHIRGQVVGVFGLTEFVFAGFYAFCVEGAVPALRFYPAAGLAVAGVLVALWRRRPPRSGGEPLVDSLPDR